MTNSISPPVRSSQLCHLTIVPAAGLTLSGSYVYTGTQTPEDVNPFTDPIEQTPISRH
ncbi:hypothetical protein RM533_12835 [Croceicoccus sp. F390]|uniref:Uncharacterized protein n=1 Tax=Croceicoccus esteveae TaxID=3075597 RepID=A0ABU2ZM06_9SPHN|nr:hypothetical protein [Croceicoccus sp. F390]MDT0577053.1 hypothetical protein [Croceicoccus sp. F390]